MPTNHEFASGVLQGADHRYMRTNCQDAVRLIRKEDRRGQPFIVGVCADGCGTREHTEVGAQLGVNLAADAIAIEYAWDTVKADLNFVKANIVRRLELVATT